MISKSELAAALAEVRAEVGLRQIDIVRRANTLRSVVSRLESRHGYHPNIDTLARYALACHLDLGLLFGAESRTGTTVHSAVTLPAITGARPFENFFGTTLATHV